MDNQTTSPVKSAPDYPNKPVRTKKVRLRTLFTSMLLLLILAGIVFIYLYYSASKPVDSVEPVAPDGPPMFLYSIYEGQNKFSHPLAVAVSKNGTIYASNNDNHTVEVISPDMRTSKSFGGQGKVPGKLFYPYGIGILPNGNILVAETGNFRVQEFSADDRYLKTFVEQNSKSGLGKPGPICIDSKGNIYIGDLSRSQVLIFDQKGQVLRKIKNISYPHGIAVDEKNRKLYISDGGGAKVKVFSLDNDRLLTTIETVLPDVRFTMVRGLAVDNRSRLYVVDTVANAIRVFDKNGKYLFSFGGQGLGDEEFVYPNQIFVDAADKIYITDWSNNRIQVWSY